MAIRWKYETWRKQYVREVGSFAQLPFIARAVAKQLLGYVDDFGRMRLNGKSPADAIAFVGGATQGDRRILRAVVPMLLEEGYIVREGDSIRIKNFVPAQAGYDRIVERDTYEVLDMTIPPSVELESDASSARVGRDSDVTLQRVSNESNARGESKPRRDSGQSGVPSLPSIKTISPGFDLEALYSLYPRKLGKTNGLKRASKQIKTPEQYERLRAAITSYADQVRRDGTEPKYVKHFSSFMGCWEDYVPNGSSEGTLDDLMAEMAEARR